MDYLYIEKSTKKIYKEKAIDVATILGGPLVAGYLIAENFKTFNETDNVRKTWFYVVIGVVLIIGSVFFIPHSKLLNLIIPAINVAIVHYFVQRFQGQNISAHLASGGQLFGWGRTIVIGLIGSLMTCILFFGFVFMLDSIVNASISEKTYGLMNHEIRFDKRNITETEIDRLADGLNEINFFDEEVTKYVFVKKENNTYKLSISVVDGIENDNQALQAFVGLKDDLQSLFPDNKIIINLVVDYLDNVIKQIE